MSRTDRAIVALLALAVAGAGGCWGDDAGDGARTRNPAPVEVAPVERGPIVLRRTFSGSLEALARFDVASQVGGRVERLLVDAGDTVARGQLVAVLEDDEFVQEVALSEAELAVAKANVTEARSRAATAQRALERMTALGGQGVASESQLDLVRTEQQAAQASLEVARAQVQRAEASLATARIRLGYTQVTARWVEGDDERVVAERFVDPGDTVSAHGPLLSIFEIDPITAVVNVTERDYRRIAPGMLATLATDAYPGRTFEAEATRVSPVFREASRQARVELQAPNRDQALKPGMFIRATLVLERAEDALIVPEAALTRRRDEDGVFVVDAAGARVAWKPVVVGIREGDRVQVTAAGGIDGRVVVLGQQLVEDGASIVIPEVVAPDVGAGG